MFLQIYAENTDMNGTCDGTNTAVLKIGFTLFISLKYVEKWRVLKDGIDCRFLIKRS